MGPKANLGRAGKNYFVSGHNWGFTIGIRLLNLRP